MDIEFYNKWCRTFAKDLQKDFGFSKDDICAILGNAGYESNGFQTLQEIKPVVPGSRGGYGIMQWTGPRRKDYEAYCKRNNLLPAAMPSNYKFLFVELSGPEKRVVQKLKDAKSLEDKTAVFCDTFLRPGVRALSQRIIWAQRARKALETVQVAEAEPEETSKTSLWDLVTKVLLLVFVRSGK